MTTIMEQITLRLASPTHTEESTAVFRDLIAALDDKSPHFDLHRLYELGAPDFELALALVADWRFRRHLYAGCGGISEALTRTQASSHLYAEPSIREALH